MDDQYAVVPNAETGRKAGLNLPRLPIVWDTNTALAVIVLGSAFTILALRGSLKGGAIQP